jgi:hypothetical protein
MTWSKVINQRSWSLCSKWFKHCSGHKFSLKAWIGLMCHRYATLDPRKCTTLIQGHLSKVKVTIHIMVKQIVYSGLNSYPSLSVWTLFHRILALDSRTWHYLDRKLFVKGQGHYVLNGLNIVHTISFHWKHGLE